MDMDEILPRVGEFGKYQKLVLWFILLPAVFPCGFHAYNQLFMASTLDHWCKVPELSQIDNKFARNISIPLATNSNGEEKFSQCYMYDFNYTIMANMTNEITKTIPCRSGWIYETENNSITSIVTEWNLVCDKKISVTLSLMLFGASGLIGNYIFGYIQDGIGRKPAYFIYLLIQCIFGIATAFAQSYTVWTIFRIGVGFTVPAILGTPYVLAIELVGPRDRTTVTILINIAYSLSLVTLSVTVWAIRNWRWMSLATTIPFFTLFLHWWTLPESPRWLLSQGRYEEAEEIIYTIGRVNGKPIAKGFITNHTNKIFVKSNIPVQQTYGIRDLLSSPNLKWKTIIVTILWFTNTSVYVGLSYYAPALGGSKFLNFFLAGAVELPTYLFLWPAMERLGRRWTLCISMIIGGTSCLATCLVQKDYIITLALYCIGKMGISSSFVVLPLMASELYPTVVRGLGMSLSSVVGMLGPIFIPLVNYLGSDMFNLPLIIMGAMLVVGGFSSLLLPETLNQHLPQTLQDAEMTGIDCFTCCNPPQVDVRIKSLLETQI